MIIVRPVGGLGNRLRVVLSFRALARALGRRFAVYWAPGPGWSTERFDELFDNHIELVDKDDYLIRRTDALPLYDRRFAGPGTREPWTGGRHGYCLKDLEDSAKTPLLLYAGGDDARNILNAEEICRLAPDLDAEIARGARGLEPASEIRARIEEVCARFDARTVGVHIRRGDALTGPHHTQFGRSTDGTFRAGMLREIALRRGASFFLATDCQATQKRFMAWLPERILINEQKVFVQSVYGGSKDNQQDAAVDLFCLSRTARILGSHWSSFSGMAAAIGGIECRVSLEQRPDSG